MRKTIFFLLLSLAVVLTLLFLTVSTIHHEDHLSYHPVTADNCDITTDLDAVEDLSVTPNLIAQFYHYYSAHHDDLTYLPEFSAENKRPDWDALSLYVFLKADLDENTAKESLFTKEKFQETLQKYMLPVDYTDGPSRYLTYENGIYTANGFDLPGAEYYRLTALTRDEQGVYTAVFDILHFEETEPFEPETSPNMRSLLAYDDAILHVSENGASLNMPKFNQAIEAIFLQEDYASIFDLAGKVTIRFTLTDDTERPFYYLACSRSK